MELGIIVRESRIEKFGLMSSRRSNGRAAVPKDRATANKRALVP